MQKTVKAEIKLLTRDEIYPILINSLVEKLPQPPPAWCASQYQRELWDMTEDFELDPFLRQSDAIEKSLYYLVDFASRMPRWINVSETNERVRDMCGELADEIDLITREPETVIAKHGKLKSWLYAKLSVQTCWIYREETARNIAEEDEAQRLRRVAQPNTSSQISNNSEGKWKSTLAQSIFQKASSKTSEVPSEQPSLF
jgi:hypothetical protein